MSTEKAPLIPLWHLHSKREKLACITDFARWKLGLLDKYLSPDFSRVERVIFVCKGNICRSAYAEAKFAALGGRAISAGTHAADGHPADSSALRIARQRGLDLTAHRTKRLSVLSPKAGDLYVCMERVHADSVVLFPNQGRQILLLGGVIGFPRISDPYNKDDLYFSTIFNQIDAALLALKISIDPE